MQIDVIDKLEFRVGKAADVEPLLTRFGVDHFSEGGFGAFSTFDLERAVREMTRLVERDDTPFIVAEVNGDVAGWISWTMMHVFTREPIAVLWTIYVRPEYRDGAIGRRLIYSALDLAKSEGACAFFMTVAPTSEPAKALCHILRQFGFVSMGGAFSKVL
jgi:L-amino acid N-acyltransferase YncA